MRPGRAYGPRHGTHPRNPARSTFDDSTADMQARACTDVKGDYHELVAEGEGNAIRATGTRGSTDEAPGGRETEGGSPPSTAGYDPDQSQGTRRTWAIPLLDNVASVEPADTFRQHVECDLMFWVSVHGPMKELIMEGELGLARDEEAKKYYKRKGITFVPRAPKQHIAHIDRRTALLRDTLHRVATQ